MKPKCRTLLIKIIVVAGTIFSSYYTLYAFSAQICYYIIKTGDTEYYSRERLEKNRQFIHTLEAAGKRDTTVIQPESDTMMWEMEAPGERTHIIAEKRGGTIDLRGEHRGVAVCKTIKIDDAPWFQAISVSLGRIASSGLSKIYFWSIRSDNLKAYKMTATQKDWQLVRLDGRQINARRFEIRPYGLLAPLWKCDCWFSEDGIFLKYRGAGWPPGSPDTEIEYRATLPDVAKRD